MENKVENEVVRKRVSITLPEDVLEWIEKHVADGTYYNLSHAIESCVKQKMKEKKE